MAILRTGYAIYPSVQLRGDKPDPKTKKLKFGILKQVLFGDYIKPYLKDGGYIHHRTEKEYIKVRTRGADGYIRPDEMQKEKILEVNFIDVGQGDGCHIVTPDDKQFIIDAGDSDNMYRFLKWRFNLKGAASAPPPFTVIVSHSDKDHYSGFSKIFSVSEGTKQQFSIDKIYHNGLVELSGKSPDSLGTPVTKNGVDYITDLCDTNGQYTKRAKEKGAGDYIKVMNKSKAPKLSLRAGDKPIYDKGSMVIEVVGPIAKKINGKDALPVLESNKGKTKNGHSVILKLTIGKLRLLLGGDLNSASENYILSELSKKDVAQLKKELRKKNLSDTKRKQLEKELVAVVQKARETLQVDIAKSCHHGSHDFTNEFLAALHPLATVISSGDEESHCHPRPDTLGTIGKYSRGNRSLIFSTELARSTKEFMEKAKKKTAGSGVKTPIGKERLVTVYGMINVRTDGERVIIAQKLEKPAAGRNWDIHKLEFNEELDVFEYRQGDKF